MESDDDQFCSSEVERGALLELRQGFAAQSDIAEFGEYVDGVIDTFEQLLIGRMDAESVNRGSPLCLPINRSLPRSVMAVPDFFSVTLNLCGHFDKERNEFFVYEFYGVSNLKFDCPQHIDFVAPLLRRNLSFYPGGRPKNSIGSSSKPAIDSNGLDFSTTTFVFAKPFKPRRISAEPSESQPNKNKPGSAYIPCSDSIKAFDGMLEVLAAQHDRLDFEKEIRPLPFVKGHSKHLLSNGSERCIISVIIKKQDDIYTLLEVAVCCEKCSWRLRARAFASLGHLSMATASIARNAETNSDFALLDE